MSNDVRLQIRLPGRLAMCVKERAHALGVSVGDVAREGLVRAVTAPLDKRSRLFLDAWLEGAEVGTDETENAPTVQE